MICIVFKLSTTHNILLFNVLLLSFQWLQTRWKHYNNTCRTRSIFNRLFTLQYAKWVKRTSKMNMHNNNNGTREYEKKKMHDIEKLVDYYCLPEVLMLFSLLCQNLYICLVFAFRDAFGVSKNFHRITEEWIIAWYDWQWAQNLALLLTLMPYMWKLNHP